MESFQPTPLIKKKGKLNFHSNTKLIRHPGYKFVLLGSLSDC